MWRPEGEHGAAEGGRPDDGDRSETTVSRGGRPRDARAHQAILDATIQLLASEGYAGLTIEAVAARAGVGKTTIYRRWPSKGPLVVDVISSMLAFGPMADTDDSRKDLMSLVGGVIGAVSAPAVAGTFCGLIGDIDKDPELAASVRNQIIAPMRAGVAAIVERAVARGEIRPDVDVDLLLDLLIGPVMMRVLITGQDLGPDMAASIVDDVLRGIQARAPGTPPGRPGGTS